MKHSMILVGADKGGVGKTTLSRALLDYLERNNVLVRAFDTENPRGTLNRFYPTKATIIDLANVADQMRILDTMESSPEQVNWRVANCSPVSSKFVHNINKSSVYIFWDIEHRLILYNLVHSYTRFWPLCSLRRVSFFAFRCCFSGLRKDQIVLLSCAAMLPLL